MTDPILKNAHNVIPMWGLFELRRVVEYSKAA